MRKSALKGVRPSAPVASGWAAMLGAEAAGPHGAAMAKLVATCASLRPTYAAVGQGRLSRAQRADLRARQRRAERKLKRWLAPRLAALLWEALADQNAKPVEQLAAIVRAVRDHWRDQDARAYALPFHGRALRLARLLRLKAGLREGDPLPIGQGDFLRELGIAPKEHDALSYYRRECHRLGIRFAARGKGTRKRSI
jgi:hypothetical protein